MSRNDKLLSEQAFLDATGLSPRGLERALQGRRVFAVGVDVGAGRRFPAFYADARFDRRHLYAVSRKMGNLTGGAKLAFFVTPKSSLGRVTLLAALAQGRLATVLIAAGGLAER